MDIDLIDFKKYNTPEEIKKYEAFIGPDGEYYKVKTRYESCDNCTHYMWADGYLKVNNLDYLRSDEKIICKCKTPLDILINYLGFIRYTHAFSSSSKVFLTFPNKFYFNYRMSRDQINSIYRLMEYNNDRIDSEIIEMIEESSSDYGKMREKVYEKIINRKS